MASRVYRNLPFVGVLQASTLAVSNKDDNGDDKWVRSKRPSQPHWKLVAIQVVRSAHLTPWASRALALLESLHNQNDDLIPWTHFHGPSHASMIQSDYLDAEAGITETSFPENCSNSDIHTKNWQSVGRNAALDMCRCLSQLEQQTISRSDA